MFNTRQFIWNGTSRLFVAEASQLGIRAGQDPPDPLTLQSAKTGRTVTFHAAGVLETDDYDGELAAWIYAADEVDVEVHILND